MAGVHDVRFLALRRQKRWDEDDARVVLAEARKSPLSLAAFAERHGLVAERLYQWSRRLEPNRDPAPPSPAMFQEVVVQRRDTRVEIELRCGRVVRVDAGVDVATLRALLNAVEAC